MADEPRQRREDDPRVAALLSLAATEPERALLSALLQSFDALEQADFGELEPFGVGSPASRS
jgi:hypothetical protein